MCHVSAFPYPPGHTPIFVPVIICTYISSMEKAMAPHSGTLAWKIPWAEEPSGLQSVVLQRVRHDWVTSLSLFIHALEKEMATHSSILAWRIPGTGEPGGLLSMGSHRVEHNWSDLTISLLWGQNLHLFFCISLSNILK